MDDQPLGLTESRRAIAVREEPRAGRLQGVRVAASRFGAVHRIEHDRMRSGSDQIAGGTSGFGASRPMEICRRLT